MKSLRERAEDTRKEVLGILEGPEGDGNSKKAAAVVESQRGDRLSFEAGLKEFGHAKQVMDETLRRPPRQGTRTLRRLTNRGERLWVWLNPGSSNPTN